MNSLKKFLLNAQAVIIGSAHVRWTAAVVCYALICAIIVYKKPAPTHELYVGQISPYDILAPFELQYEDVEETELKRAKAALEIPDNMMLNEKPTKEILHNFDSATAKAGTNEAAAKKNGAGSLLKDEETAKIRELLEDILANGVFDKSYIASISSASQSIIFNGRLIPLTGLYYDGESDHKLMNFINLRIPFASQEAKDIYENILKNVIQPNTMYDDHTTKLMKQKAQHSIPVVMKTIKKGQIIIRRGDEVTKVHAAQIEALNNLNAKSMMGSMSAPFVISTCILVFIVFMVAFWHLRLRSPKLLTNNSVIMLLCSISVALAFFSKHVMAQLQPSALAGFKYVSAVPLGALLASVLVSAELGIFFTVVWCMLLVVLYTASTDIVLICALSSLMFVFFSSRVSKRSQLLKTGIAAGVMTAIAVCAAGIQAGTPLNVFGLQAGISMASCFTTSILAIGILPVIEHSLLFCTDITLLELSDLNHPLLRRLMVEAPGTYHHSLMAGNLAEAAAEEVGANSLFAKVGAYFHDIGKAVKPEYFFENVWNEKSMHEDLPPSMSNLIILSHVKEGIELARSNGIPEKIIDIINEHHGTSLIYFFYKRAQRKTPAKTERVEEKQYRYPGPKPQTRESALVMLADSVEAASRALDRPTPARLDSLVKEIINQKCVDGQLDECDLSFKDLATIAERFTRLLNATFHTRIKYPQDEKQNDSSAEDHVNGQKNKD